MTMTLLINKISYADKFNQIVSYEVIQAIVVTETSFFETTF